MSIRKRKPYLSKSKLIAAWQCMKKLHLEINHPELGEISDSTEAMVEIVQVLPMHNVVCEVTSA